jgi:peptidoglycan/LPS O-acetylase OafA/YrhL
LRGIAALGVVFWHYGVHFDARPLQVLLLPFYNAGFLLVDFFFVLSGFVIAGAYWREPRRRDFRRNVWARVARLYPLHLFTLVATLLLLAALPAAATPDPEFAPPTNDLRHLVLNLLLLNQVGLQGGYSFNTPAWSISAEFVINVAFLGAIALAPRARAVALLLGALACVVLVAMSTPPYVDGQFAFGWIDVGLLRCVLGFFAGVALHLLVAAGWLERLRSLPRLVDVLALLALSSLGLLLVASGRHPPAWHYPMSIAVATACVALTPLSSLAGRLLRHRALTFLGDISYSVYLVHFPLQLALHVLVARGLAAPDYASPWVLLGYVAAVVAVSAATHRRLELHWQSRLLGRA